MRALLPRLLPLALLLAHVPAFAAEPASPPGGNLLRVLFGLIVVLALMAGAAWMMRRMGVAGMHANSVAKVVGGVAVGNRERVVVVEVADQWIVVGVAPGRVSALQTMPRQELAAGLHNPAGPDNFSTWLKRTMDKRNQR